MRAYVARRRSRLDMTLQTLAGDHEQRTKMWWTLSLFLLALWMLGVATSTGGGAIHALLGAAAALLALLWLRKRPLAESRAKP